jgi:hypothetical protein
MEPPQPSLELDMINNLTHLTSCNFVVLVRGSYQMEVGKELVYPDLALLDYALIDSANFVAVKVDTVQENVKTKSWKWHRMI